MIWYFSENNVNFLIYEAVDDDFNQTGQLLAGLLRWPQATFASKIKVNDGGSLDVTREVDSGL